MNYDFRKARKVYLELTDTQKIWMSIMRRIDEIRTKDAESKYKLEQTMSKVFRRGRYV